MLNPTTKSAANKKNWRSDIPIGRIEEDKQPLIPRTCSMGYINISLGVRGRPHCDGSLCYSSCETVVSDVSWVAFRMLQDTGDSQLECSRHARV